MAKTITVSLTVDFEVEDLVEYLVDVAGLEEAKITEADIIEVAKTWAVDHFDENNDEKLFTVATDGEVID